MNVWKRAALLWWRSVCEDKPRPLGVCGEIKAAFQLPRTTRAQHELALKVWNQPVAHRRSDELELRKTLSEMTAQLCALLCCLALYLWQPLRSGVCLLQTSDKTWGFDLWLLRPFANVFISVKWSHYISGCVSDLLVSTKHVGEEHFRMYVAPAVLSASLILHNRLFLLITVLSVISLINSLFSIISTLSVSCLTPVNI